MRRRSAALAVVAVLALTACSGGDDATPTSTAASTAAPTTAETTTTTAAPTTPSPTTTAPAPTTAPPTAPVTSAATAPLDPIADLAAALQRDASDAELALLEAIGAPGDAASRSLVERYYAGDSLVRVIEALDFLVENGLIGSVNPEVPSVLVVLDLPTLVPGSTTEAEARTCRVDAAVVSRLLSNDPNGPSAVYNDRITRTVALTRFSLANGIWRVAGGTTIDEAIGETSCAGV